MKKQVNPIVTALILIGVIGAVLGFYSHGLLGGKKGGRAGGGGGAAPMAPPPPEGLPTVTVTTLTGWVRPGFADGNGSQARLNGPSALAAAPDGSLYVCDSRNHRVRRATPDGALTTVAGSGPADCLPGGFADGPAAEARLFNPTGVCVGDDGAIYVADTGNHRIRVVKDGRVSTLAGGPTARDSLGLEQGDFRDGVGPEARFRFPAAMVRTESGDLLVADVGNAAVRRVTAAGQVTTVARGGLLKSPTGLLLPAAGTLWVADSEAAALLEVADSGAKVVPPASVGLPPRRPCAACSVPGGGLVVADAEWHALFGVKGPAGSILLAGHLPTTPGAGYKDGTGDKARFARPCALAYARGVLYVADFGNNCVRALTGPGLDPATWQPAAPPPGRGFGRQSGGRGAGGGRRGRRAPGGGPPAGPPTGARKDGGGAGH